MAIFIVSVLQVVLEPGPACKALAFKSGDCIAVLQRQAVFLQGPRRMLPGRPAAEVRTRKQDAGIPEPRPVQDEVRIRFAGIEVHAEFAAIEVSPFVEAERA